MAQLAGFEIARRGKEYLIHFNTEGGETVEIVANFEQMDLIAEEIDRVLDRDEEQALGVDEAPTDTDVAGE